MPDPTSVDLIVSGGSIITMDAARRIIRDGALAITGDRIVAVGKRADVQRSHRAARTLDASRSVIVPGFVNSHIHFYHHMHRGMAPDTFDGNQWSNFVHARVAPVLTVEDEIWAAYLVLIELMKSGSTTYLAAGSYNPGPVLEAIPRVGLRGFESRRTFEDRKSTRLNSSHLGISYAVFCLKKKKQRLYESASLERSQTYT